MAFGTNGTYYWISRLALGTNGQVLTMSGGEPVWAANAAGFADPMTTRGDVIVRDATNTTARLAIGANTYVLTSDGTDISWAPSGSAPVTTVFTRTGAVVAATNDYTWAQINKSTSDLADITTKSHTSLTDKGTNTHAQIDTHIANVTTNPHSVTATNVGLGNVDNTSDANKPVSTAQQTALDLKANLASPTFTGTVGGITATMVGLGNVVNADTTTTANITDSSNKRFMTDAQETNLDAQSGTNTGDQTSVSGSSGDTDALNSATTTVDVSAATAPTTGQVLTATSGTAATWQTPAGGGFTDPMTTDGDIIVRDATNTTVRLPAGTSGQVLQTNGNAAAPSWVTPVVYTQAQYTDATGAQSVNATSNVTIPMSTADFEDADYSNTAGVVTVTDAGRYKISSWVTITGTTANYRYTCIMGIYKNGSTLLKEIEGGYIRNAGGSNTTYVAIDYTAVLAASDTIEIKIKRANTVTGDATTVASQNNLSIERKS